MIKSIQPEGCKQNLHTDSCNMLHKQQKETKIAEDIKNSCHTVFFLNLMVLVLFFSFDVILWNKTSRYNNFIALAFCCSFCRIPGLFGPPVMSHTYSSMAKMSTAIACSKITLETVYIINNMAELSFSGWAVVWVSHETLLNILE